jgi:PAS domain S-box-containing protein
MNNVAVAVAGSGNFYVHDRRLSEKSKSRSVRFSPVRLSVRPPPDGRPDFSIFRCGIFYPYALLDRRGITNNQKASSHFNFYSALVRESALSLDGALVLRRMEAMNALIESAVDPIIQIDDHGKILVVNHACLKVFHYQSESDVVGQNVKILMPESYARRHDEYLERYRVTRQKRVLGAGRRLQGRRSDGSVFPIFLSLSEAVLGGKTVFTGIVRDLQTEEQHKERLLSILTSSVDPIAQIDAKGIIQTVNPACCKAFRYLEHELVGQNVSKLMPHPHAHLHDSYMQRYATTGNKKIIGIGRKVRGLRSDGTTFGLFLTVSEAKIGNDVFYTGIMRDLSAEEEEREALETILTSAVDAIVVIDSNGIIERANPACSTTFGYTREELIGSDINILMPEHHAANHGRYLQRFFESKHNSNATTTTSNVVGQGRDLEAKRKDGSIFPIFLTVSECILASKNRSVFIGIMRDMTERQKAMEAELEREKNEALLHNLLPKSISTRLKSIPHDETIADYFESVTILFVDVVGFTKYSSTRSPVEIVRFLNTFFRGLDGLVDKYGLEKIKTIGDAYMVVSGLWMEKNHTLEMLEFALDVITFVQEVNKNNPFVEHQLSVRIGIGTGSVVAGVVGSKKRFFDLWGDAVNTSSRMESSGIENCIQVTEEVAVVARKYPDKFTVVDRGIIEVKGKGEMKVFLIGEKESECAIRDRLRRHSRLMKRESKVLFQKMSEEFKPVGARSQLLLAVTFFSIGYLLGGRYRR